MGSGQVWWMADGGEFTQELSRNCLLLRSATQEPFVAPAPSEMSACAETCSATTLSRLLRSKTLVVSCVPYLSEICAKCAGPKISLGIVG